MNELDVTFRSGSDMPIIDNKVLEEYTVLKQKLSVLIKKEERLKKQIKSAMLN